MKNLLFALLLVAQSAISMEGLKVGAKAPNLILKDTQGNDFNFSQTEKDTVVIFYRGAWCPYCIKQLDSVQKEVYGKKDKAQIVAVSVDRMPVAKKMKDKQNYDFRVISDPKAESLKAFNIVNKLDDELVAKYKESYKIDVEGDSGETHHMVAHPAVFIIKNGVITFSDIHTNYKKRTNNATILDRL